ncbi:MAG: hypothetical protein EA422_01030 [Gemmatimonadales bacterium]|nr:MAG: hypothetical protein EA422_01030 [Gemmatimonadales bacterium]
MRHLPGDSNRTAGFCGSPQPGDEPASSLHRRTVPDDLLKANEAISIAHVLKEQLKQIWTTRSPWAARRALRDWCSLASVPPAEMAAHG